MLTVSSGPFRRDIAGDVAGLRLKAAEYGQYMHAAEQVSPSIARWVYLGCGTSIMSAWGGEWGGRGRDAAHNPPQHPALAALIRGPV